MKRRCKSLEPWASAEECVPAKNKMQAGTLSCLGPDFLPVICTDYTLANTSNANIDNDKQISDLGKEGIWEGKGGKVEEEEGETENFEKKSKEGKIEEQGRRGEWRRWGRCAGCPGQHLPTVHYHHHHHHH